MAIRLKSIAFLLVAALLVSAGYFETQQNMLGLNDDAYMAYAALNADNTQVSPSITTVPTQAIGNLAAVASPTALTGLALGTQYGTPGTSTLAQIKEAFATNVGAALPVEFTPILPPRVISVTHAGATGAVLALPQGTVTVAAGDNFDGTTPSQLVLYKYNSTSLSYEELPYVSVAPSTTAPTTNSWALFDYNGGGAGVPTFQTANDAFAAGEEVLLVCYIVNDGPYDTNAAVNTVQDPPALGVATASSLGLSSGSTGCVFNPMATLSIEWLLLLIAPALMIIRRKK